MFRKSKPERYVIKPTVLLYSLADKNIKLEDRFKMWKYIQEKLDQNYSNISLSDYKERYLDTNDLMHPTVVLIGKR